MEVLLSNTKTATPTYDRSRLTTKIVHLRFGAFHRAHQAVYAHQLAKAFESDWGYAVVNLVGGEQQIADLTHQNLLFTVAEMSPAGWNAQVVGVVKQALHIHIDGVEAILALLSEPQIAIVSLTVTEKGYCHSPADGELQLLHPMIAADLANPNHPRSAPGVIVNALARRRATGLPGFSIMSCDNMPDNGRVTRNVIERYARAIDPDLADWIDENVSFPSTMVDRIVPAVTTQTLDKIEQITGVRDPVAVACEPFRQWVIEDHFVAGRPAWEKVGAQLVSNVLPFEEMKLRMLNGSHSYLAYLGYLAGYQTVHDCMQDEAFRRTAHALMLKEQAPTLSVQGVDLPRYADQLIERYSNPELHHRTFQIAMDGSLKLPQRMLDSIRWHLAHHSSFDLLALGVAAWMRYVEGIDEHGQPIEVSDPLLPLIQTAMTNDQQVDTRVTALLGIKEIFGTDLCHNAELKNALIKASERLRAEGAKRTVQRYANALNCEI